MKKSDYKKLILQQSQQITKLQKENRYLREMFVRIKNNIMMEISQMIGTR